MILNFHNSSLASIMQARGELKSLGKLVFSNFYGLSDCTQYQMFKASHTLLVRFKEHDFFRLSAVSTNLEELRNIFSILNDNIYALNIPSKRDISEEREFLESCGFSLLGIYNRYYNKNIIKRENACGSYALKQDFNDIKSLLYDNFIFYTDHLPSEDEIKQMIDNKQIVVNRFEDGKVGGLVIHTIEDKNAYINAWIDKTGNGIPLMFKTYNIIKEKGISYAYLWINSTNRNVIVLHKMMGAKPDGLVDYTFVKNR